MREELVKIVIEKKLGENRVTKTLEEVNNDKAYLLWLTLIKEELREDHNIEFFEKSFYNSLLNKKTYIVDAFDIKSSSMKKIERKESYTQALEEGIYQAILNFI